ncbi:MAG: DUF2767 family protein [Duncaniella sp.]|nr:DUF2767 family protein [Duncaniella sp.]
MLTVPVKRRIKCLPRYTVLGKYRLFQQLAQRVGAEFARVVGHRLAGVNVGHEQRHIIRGDYIRRSLAARREQCDYNYCEISRQTVHFSDWGLSIPSARRRRADGVRIYFE